jgi:hypothetical protein
MAALPALTQDTAAALAAGAFLAMLPVAAWGAPILAKTSAGRLLQVRRAATLAVLLAMAAVAAVVAAASPSAGGLIVAGGTTAALVMLHAARDPARTGLWHHRRLRPAWALGVTAAAVGLALQLSEPVLAPPLMAVLVLRRHLRGAAQMHADALRDLGDLRIRQVRLVAELQQESVQPRPAALPGPRPAPDMRRDNWPAAG